MAQKSAPPGTYQFEQVKVLSEEDADYIAKWSAKAFSKDGFWNYRITGKTYEEDPVAHELYTRAMLDRASIEGYHVVNKTRTAIRTVFPPGSKDQRMDFDWNTPYDKAWNMFLKHCGGKEHLRSRSKELGNAMSEELTKLYGPEGAQDLFVTTGLTVHPDYHGRGVGTTLHRYVEELARQSGEKWYFTTTLHNQRFYENLGCKIVGDPISTMLDERGKARYPQGVVLRICEVGVGPGRVRDIASLPDGSFEIEEVKHFTDADADYIADWMAGAFSKTDCFYYTVIGRTYEEDPEAHRLLARCVLDRGSVHGVHVTNKARTALRTYFPPGCSDRRMDFDWVSPCDETWVRFIEHCGGKERLKERLREHSQSFDRVIRALYGPDEGLELYNTAGFAVHPDYQGYGIGTAVHEHIASLARKDGKKWFFTSLNHHASYYLRRGCKIVGEPLPTHLDDKGKKSYPPGNDLEFICEYDPNVSVD